MSTRKNIWMATLTIITACCVIGGTFYHTGIFGFGAGFRFGENRTTSASSDLEAFRGINVDADMMNLSIESGNRFYLDGKYTDRLKFEYEVKDETLYIKQQKSSKMNFWGRNLNEDCDVTLTVPENATIDFIEAKVAMGNINMENITSLDCEAVTNMGNCTFEKCSFNKADIDNNMGEITIKDTALGKAEIDNDMGSIRIEYCIFQNLQADNSMGDIYIDADQNLDQYEIELEAEMGNVRVNSQSQGTKYHQSGNSGKLEANTSMGNVVVKYKNAE